MQDIAFGIFERFIDRQQQLDQIASALANNKNYVLVFGEPGVGKTSLLKVFSEKFASLFPGGVFNPDFLSRRIIGNKSLISYPPSQRTLLVVDDIELLSPPAISDIRLSLKLMHNLRLLAAGRRYLDILRVPDIAIELRGLTQAAFQELFEARLSNLDINNINNLFDKSQGNPRLALLAAEALKNGVVDWEQLVKGYNNFDYPAVYGPDGKSIKSYEPPKQLITEIKEINDELLNRLKSDPNLMRELSSEKFEELVAELLHRMGYEIDMTPKTRDGGFDMFAAKKDEIAKFIYLVECKRFTPPNKVGVQYVRALHGVVQQQQANAGIIVTTSFFTSGAKEFQSQLQTQMHLKDYLVLQRWLGII